MALVTVQRSPSPSNSPGRDNSDDEVDGVDESSSVRRRRSKSALKRLRKFFHTARFISKLRPRFSESYFAVKGAALVLPQSDCARKITKSTHGGDISVHLQSMFYLLRPHDTIKVAVKLESMHAAHNRYVVVVTANSTQQDPEASVILGIDCNQTATIGLVLPVFSDTKISLDGDGGFSIYSNGHYHLFKPISVQAMWSALQSLHKVVSVAVSNYYFPEGLSHSWIDYYTTRLISDRVCIAEWFLTEDTETIKSESNRLETDDPSEALKLTIMSKLREIMMTVDLEEVTSRSLRIRLEGDLGQSLEEYKSYIDQEMLIIMGQMDAASEIFDYLFLGSEWNASNLEELKEKKIHYILNITKEIDNFFPGIFVYMNIREYDAEDTDLMKHWERTYKFINKARKSGSKVLVHCKMGVSRSASTVIAYAMKERGWTLNEAHKHVKQKRNVVKPLPNFMKQLETYQGILNASRQRFNTLFKSKSVNNLDQKSLPVLKDDLESLTLEAPFANSGGSLETRRKSWTTDDEFIRKLSKDSSLTNGDNSGFFLGDASDGSSTSTESMEISDNAEQDEPRPVITLGSDSEQSIPVFTLESETDEHPVPLCIDNENDNKPLKSGPGEHMADGLLRISREVEMVAETESNEQNVVSMAVEREHEDLAVVRQADIAETCEHSICPLTVNQECKPALSDCVASTTDNQITSPILEAVVDDYTSAANIRLRSAGCVLESDNINYDETSTVASNVEDIEVSAIMSNSQSLPLADDMTPRDSDSRGSHSKNSSLPRGVRADDSWIKCSLEISAANEEAVDMDKTVLNKTTDDDVSDVLIEESAILTSSDNVHRTSDILIDKEDSCAWGDMIQPDVCARDELLEEVCTVSDINPSETIALLNNTQSSPDLARDADYAKECIHWIPGSVKRQTQEMEERLQNSEHSNRSSVCSEILSSDIVDGKCPVASLDENEHGNITVPLVSESSTLSSNEQSVACLKDNVMVRTVLRELEDSSSSIGAIRSTSARKSSVYDMEDIDLPEGLVRRTKLEIEENSKSLPSEWIECSGVGMISKPVQRSLSLKTVCSLPQNDEQDGEDESVPQSPNRRKTCTVVLSASELEGSKEVPNSEPLELIQIGSEEVPVPVGKVARHMQDFESLKIDPDVLSNKSEATAHISHNVLKAPETCSSSPLNAELTEPCSNESTSDVSCVTVSSSAASGQVVPQVHEDTGLPLDIYTADDAGCVPDKDSVHSLSSENDDTMVVQSEIFPQKSSSIASSTMFIAPEIPLFSAYDYPATTCCIEILAHVMDPVYSQITNNSSPIWPSARIPSTALQLGQTSLVSSPLSMSTTNQPCPAANTTTRTTMAATAAASIATTTTTLFTLAPRPFPSCFSTSSTVLDMLPISSAVRHNLQLKQDDINSSGNSSDFDRPTVGGSGVHPRPVSASNTDACAHTPVKRCAHSASFSSTFKRFASSPDLSVTMLSNLEPPQPDDKICASKTKSILMPHPFSSCTGDAVVSSTNDITSSDIGRTPSSSISSTKLGSNRPRTKFSKEMLSMIREIGSALTYKPIDEGEKSRKPVSNVKRLVHEIEKAEGKHVPFMERIVIIEKDIQNIDAQKQIIASNSFDETTYRTGNERASGDELGWLQSKRESFISRDNDTKSDSIKRNSHQYSVSPEPSASLEIAHVNTSTGRNVSPICVSNTDLKLVSDKTIVVPYKDGKHARTKKSEVSQKDVTQSTPISECTDVNIYQEEFQESSLVSNDTDCFEDSLVKTLVGKFEHGQTGDVEKCQEPPGISFINISDCPSDTEREEIHAFKDTKTSDHRNISTPNLPIVDSSKDAISEIPTLYEKAQNTCFNFAMTNITEDESLASNVPATHPTNADTTVPQIHTPRLWSHVSSPSSDTVFKRQPGQVKRSLSSASVPHSVIPSHRRSHSGAEGWKIRHCQGRSHPLTKLWQHSTM